MKSDLVHRHARYMAVRPIARARVRTLRILILVAGLFCAPGAALAQQHAAQEHMATGRAAFERGAFDRAIESWSLAAIASERAGDRAGQIQALVYASEAYAVLGRYRQAVGVLDRALKLAESSEDRSQVPWILSRLGNVLIATGPADTAETTLKRSLDMARDGRDPALTAAVLNDLGNFLMTRRKAREAVAAYRESTALA
jgi:tetratricopeptide (TPR) repeat protein